VAAAGTLESRALVLSGGGVAGISWMLGIVEGLARGGVDLVAADQISGTSAGACVAAQIATGARAEAIERQRREENAEIVVPFAIDEFLAAIDRAREEEPTAAAARVRIARMEPLGPHISAAERRAVIAARLPRQEWPVQRLAINAVDAETGEWVWFDRDSGVSLLDAVVASTALPGIWAAAEIDGRRYVDGGIRSLSNADAAAGYDRALILAPTELSDSVRSHLATESAAIAPARVHLISLDPASVEAIGDNPLDPVHRRPALEAGLAQAADELAAARDFWA
jgi:NTE family protein